MISVCLVDDQTLVRQGVKSLLDLSDDIRVCAEASDGAQALSLLRSLDPKPRVILLDLMMPVMDGREFREHQLRDPSIADIPVVVISASRDIDSWLAGEPGDQVR